MLRFKKRRFKKILITNKNKIIFAAAILFVTLLGVGYAAFSEVLTVVGRGRIEIPTCQKHVTGSFVVTGSWPGAERVTVYVNNYESTMLENFTLELKVPDGTSAGPFNECVNHTVDGYLYPSADGIITITLNHGNNGTCEWISKIAGATTNDGVTTPGSWGGGNGFGFQLNSSLIDSNNTLEPTFINFEGCTIVGDGGNQETPLSALGLSPATATIGIGERINLTTTKTPAYKQVNLTYTSSDTSIATVDSNGSVIGVSPGTVTITVSAEGISATSTITVESHVVVPESISITPSSYRLLEGESVPLQTTITPSGAITELTWSSSDSSVATVDSNGNVLGISPGTAISTVTTANGITSTCDIRVIEPAVSNDVDINISHYHEYSYGDNYMFTITIENLTNERINDFRIGLDIPTDVRFDFWNHMVEQDGNHIQLIDSEYFYIEPNDTFTIQGALYFPEKYLLDGTNPWGGYAQIIPSEYLYPEITSIELN